MMSLSKGAHPMERTPGRGSGMAGIGLRGESELDKDNTERTKRDLDKDTHAMQVDAGTDRPAKDKPVETTPQIMKNTRTKGEEATAAAARRAAANRDPQNIPINTPKERRETPLAGSAPQANTNPRPRTGRSRERSVERAGRIAPVSASVAAEATEATRSAAPSEGCYTKQQNQLANQGQTLVTMDMIQKCLQVVQDSQGEIERKLDDHRADQGEHRKDQGTRETGSIPTDREERHRGRIKRKAIRHHGDPQGSYTGRQDITHHVHPSGDRSDKSLSTKSRGHGNCDRTRYGG